MAKIAGEMLILKNKMDNMPFSWEVFHSLSSVAASLSSFLFALQDSVWTHPPRPKQTSKMLKSWQNKLSCDFSNLIQSCISHQQFVKVLDIIGFKEGEVSWWLVVHLFHCAVLYLHVETCHSTNGSWCSWQLSCWSTNGHITCWGRQDLYRGRVLKQCFFFFLMEIPKQ